jgi:hypothetical protein
MPVNTPSSRASNEPSARTIMTPVAIGVPTRAPVRWWTSGPYRVVFPLMCSTLVTPTVELKVPLAIWIVEPVALVDRRRGSTSTVANAIVSRFKVSFLR